MGSEEDDYMSDLFVQPAAAETPKDSFNVWRKRKLGLDKRKPKPTDEQPSKPKSKRVLESETRDKGLSTSALQADNPGLKLMAKMGYKCGDGLGKSKDGRVEPIPISLKSNRGGLGKEAREKEVQVQKAKAREAAKQTRLKMQEYQQQDFRLRMRDRFREQKMTTDLHRSQKVCNQLDEDNGAAEPEVSYFWPDAMNPVEEYDDDEEYYDEYEELSSEEKLVSLTSYLRTNYFYCVWCATAYADCDDLGTNCPGDTADVHDE